MTAKSLPQATVDVIDPESGTSSGTSGSDVNIAVGDIILFRFAFTPVPDARNRSMQAWLTEYIPPGTELVGARLIDSNGLTIKPRLPGLAVDGCGGGSTCNDFDDLPCTAGSARTGATACASSQRSFAGGSISQVHADTGIFWTGSSLLSRLPNDRFLAFKCTGTAAQCGIQMDPIPNGISPDLTQILDLTSGPYWAHNVWDWAQVLAYGVTGNGTNSRGEPINPTGQGGDGNTPYLYGSPVAGPHTFYRYEATPTVNGSGNITAIDFDDTDGPWRRVQYPGSMTGFGDCRTNSSAGLTCSPNVTDAQFQRNITLAASGDDVTPNNPASATAVRFALGEMRTGDPVYVEVALRVTQVPFDPNYGSGGDNVDCGEVIGSSLAARGTGQDGDTNPWVTYLGTPACVFLKLLFNITTDKPLSAGSTSNFTMRMKNLKTTAETGVVGYMEYSSNRLAYQTGSATIAPSFGPAACPAPLDTSKQCLGWNVGTLNPSDEFEVTASFLAGGSGGTSGVLRGHYFSDSLGGGFSSSDITIITPIAKVNATLAYPNPTTTFAAPGGTATLTGTLSNAGTQDFDFDHFGVFLPAGWTVASLSVGGSTVACTASCGTNTPEFDYPVSYTSGTSNALSITVNVPSSPTTIRIETVDFQIWGTQTGFGGDWETYFPDIAEIPVAAVRTAKPVIDCAALGSTSTSIDGTSEPDADVRALFNLIERGNDTADGTGDWSVTNYSSFGELYGGLEVRATAQVTGKNVSELSDACDTEARRQCSDGLDNDGDGLTDFPADPGCTSPTDNKELDDVHQCSDGLDNNSANGTDWPADPSCDGPDDDTEDGVPACSDGVNNDGDGATDYPADSDCTSAADITEEYTRQCQNRIDDDGDGLIDFDGLGNPALADPGCHSAFDDSELDPSYTDDARGRLLVIMDTSGSMNRNTCEDDPADLPFTGGDGSLDCPGSDVACADIPAGCASGQATCGNGVADDSRLYKVKGGISDVVASFGEVEYALMRFHERGTDFACPGTNAGLTSGGWQGGGLAPCGGGFDSGDLVVSFSRDNQQSLLDWMDGETNYPVGDPPARLDEELRGSGSTPLAGSMSSALTYLSGVESTDAFVPCRQYRVILVTDGEETCGTQVDAEAAAYALYSNGFPVTVIGFATSDATIVNNLNRIARRGQGLVATDTSVNAVVVSDEAALSAAIAQVVEDSIVFETCDGQDNDCDGLTDEGYPINQACDDGGLGVCLGTGTTICDPTDDTQVICDITNPGGTSGTEVCNSVDDDCDGKIDETLTCNCVPEICNGLDDDCDGSVNEGAPQGADPLPGEGGACGISVGECTPGQLVCVRDNTDPKYGKLDCQGGQPPQPETCDTLDNDCDSFIDEIATECYDYGSGCTLGPPSSCVGTCQTGLQTCVDDGMGGSVLSSCQGEVGPVNPEICNGLDDNCDGNVNDNFPTLGDACDNGQPGICNATGVLVCNSAGDGVECNAPTINPGIEICNGLDDDCDGTPDNNLGSPVGDSCGGGGGCSGGTFQCVPDGMGGATIECTGQTGGSPETCNGKDDDCDMRVDETPTDPELNPPPGDDCVPPGYETQGDTGSCEFGHYICQAGMIVCDGYVGPTPETCNGVDDDCDGNVNNAADCPIAGDICLEGECVEPCKMAEFPCPFGFMCEQVDDSLCDSPPCKFCVTDPCKDVTCQSGFSCDSSTGQCVDLCDGINCPTDKTCVNGFCLDCFQTGCADGQICVPGTGCVDDPCADVQCNTDEYCRDGTCVKTYCDPACAEGQRCVDGACEDDPCSGVQCGNNRVCNPETGECVPDSCTDRVCGAGEACRPGDGECIPDPCLLTDCPTGLECHVDFDGAAYCAAPPPPQDNGDYIYASGGGCSTGGNGGSWLLMLLGLPLAIGRRRRRRR